MKKMIQNALWRDFIGATLCLVMTFVLLMMVSGCSEDSKSVSSLGGAGEETGIIANSQYYSIKGSAQRLNQLVNQVVEQVNEHSDVDFDYHNLGMRVSELDSTTLDTTGVVFYGTFNDATGTFALDSVSLNSPYVMLEVSPHIIDGNEYIWGSWVYTDVFMPSVIVDLRKTSSVNVNKMTTLERFRLVHLFKTGMTFEEAKNQADREILDAFGMSDMQFTFENIENAEDHDNVALLNLVDDYLYGRDETRAAVRMLEEYGSFENDSVVIGRWTNWSLNALDGYMRVKEDSLSESAKYDKFLEENFVATLLRLDECSATNEGEAFDVGDRLFNLVCLSGHWTATLRTINHGDGELTDERDGKTYKTVSYLIDGDSVTWLAENLMYNSNDGLYSMPAYMALDSAAIMNSYEKCFAEWTPVVSDDTVLFTLTASDSLKVDSICVYQQYYPDYEALYSVMDSLGISGSNIQGICPDGWRLPTANDWLALLDHVEKEFDTEYWNLADFLYGAGFDVVTAEERTYFAIKPDSTYEEDKNASVITFDRGGKWLVLPQVSWSTWALPEGRFSYVRCIKE
jgi:uncharacterized protein (TIGR02145 family)